MNNKQNLEDWLDENPPERLRELIEINNDEYLMKRLISHIPEKHYFGFLKASIIKESYVALINSQDLIVKVGYPAFEYALDNLLINSYLNYQTAWILKLIARIIGITQEMINKVQTLGPEYDKVKKILLDTFKRLERKKEKQMRILLILMRKRDHELYCKNL
jgi:hypothetical protein